VRLIKTVLIIGYLHPYTRSGGSFRLVPLASHLPEFGWEPVVLTPYLLDKADLPFRVIETQYQDYLNFWRKLLGFDKDKDIKRQIKGYLGEFSRSPLLEFFFNRIGEALHYPDSHKGWKSFALKAGAELLKSEKIDAIISCHPTISHIIARKLKEDSGIPWIADLPDLWSHNHNYPYTPLRRYFDTCLELKTLSSADILTTVSEPWADTLRSLHKGKQVHSITHGFNPDEVNEPPAELTAKFTVTYTGSIYTRKINPVKFFMALRELILDGEIDTRDIEVRFYGVIADWVNKEIKQYGLTGVVNLYGRVSRGVAVQKQRESQLLFLTKWQDLRNRGAYSGKIFEYLAARRPILATDGSNDVVKDLLNETNAGIDAPTIENIKDALQKMYHDYKLRGEIVYNGIDASINKYSHREITRKFSAILDHLSRK